MAAGKHIRPPDESWMVQIQYKPGEPWHDHTGDLASREAAEALIVERKARFPKQAYRPVLVTTTYTLGPAS